MTDNYYEQVVNSGLLYVNGFTIARSGNTTLKIYDGAARNTTNSIDMSVTTTLGYTTLHFATIGAINGLDTGAIGASACYAIYVVSDPTGYNPTGFMASLDTDSPILPTGYGVWERIGWWFTTSGSVLQGMQQTGNGQTRQYNYLGGISNVVLNAGTATTETSVDLSAYVPAIATNVDLDLLFVPNSASDIATLSTEDAATTAYFTFKGSVSAVGAQTYTRMPISSTAGVPLFKYKQTSGSDALTIYLLGFTDYL